MIEMAQENLILESCWDKAGDGTLVYHARVHCSTMEPEALFRVTIEFFPSARRCLSDAGCQSLVEGMAREQIQQALQQLSPASK